MNKTISKKNLIILGVILVAFPFVADKMFNWNYGVLLANFAILYIIAVSGLDILFGYSGQISMGHAAFYCIGAYGSVLIHQFTGLPVIVTILMGTVIATLIGALLMAVIRNGLNLMGASNDIQYIVIGAVIILAVTIDVFRNKAEARARKMAAQ